MKTVEICLTRHAQSVSNAEGRWQGHGDSPLSEDGKRQVAALSRTLRKAHFDITISSDLRRTVETSAAVEHTVEPDPLWREIDVGAWEGLTMAEVFERFPDEIAALRQRKPIAIGGGESWLDVFERSAQALNALRARLDDGQRAIVFTHGGVIAAILAGLLGAHDRWPWPLGRVHNTARTVLRFEGDNASLITHNCASHLSHEGMSARLPLRDDQMLLALASGSWEDASPEARGDAQPIEVPADVSLSSIRALAKEHGGTRCGVGVDAAHIVAIAQAVAQPTGAPFGFCPPQRGSLTHLLATAENAVLIDFQVGDESTFQI